MNTAVAKIPDDPSFGEAMRALPEKERAFVMFHLEGRSWAEAAKLAGFGNEDGTSNANTYARIGYRLSHRPRVLEAIQEELRKLVRLAGVPAMETVKSILQNPYHKDAARVSLAILERIEPTVQKSQVEITHKFDPTKTTLELLAAWKRQGWTREQLLAEFSPFELDHYEKLLALEDKGQTVDVDFVEIKDPDFDLLGD